MEIEFTITILYFQETYKSQKLSSKPSDIPNYYLYSRLIVDSIFSSKINLEI